MRRAGRAEIRSRGAQGRAQGSQKKPFTWASFPATRRKKPLHQSKALQSGLPRRADGTLCSAKEPSNATASLHLPIAALSPMHRPELGILLQRFPAVVEAFPWNDTCLFTATSKQQEPATLQPQRSGCLLQYCQLGIPPLTGAYLAVCPEAQSACPSRGTAPSSPATVSPSQGTKKPAHGWEGLTAVRAEPPLPPPALCFTGRSYYQEMFPSAPLIPLFTAQ